MENAADKSSLHVLTITPFYPTADDDANGCFVAEPLSTLAALGVTNSVLAVEPFYRKRGRGNSSAPPAEFFRYFSLPGRWDLASAGAFLFASILGHVRDLHRRRKIDVMHAHGPLPCGHAAMLLSRELTVPYVVTVHGLDAYSTRQVRGLAGEWCRRVTAHVFRAAASVICISERVRENVLTGCPNVRTSVVYNGTNTHLFSPGSEQAQSPSILSVGNLIPIKGHAVLLRAMAAVATHPDLRLDLVGQGPEHASLVDLAQELGILDRVRFLGRVSRREVTCLLRNCTLFALPSRYEGLGCAYLEAMSSEKVAIGCLGQGIDEVIRHGSNGWLVEPENVEQLSSALVSLLGNSMLREYIGRQARQTILNGFTLEQQAQDLMRVYRECMA
jgi:glycosyltransferase involved in cell wall biosynthesis